MYIGLLQQINFPRASCRFGFSKYSQNIGEAKNGGTLKFSDFFEIQKMPNFSDFFKILTKFFKNLSNFTNLLNPHFWPLPCLGTSRKNNLSRMFLGERHKSTSHTTNTTAEKHKTKNKIPKIWLQLVFS